MNMQPHALSFASYNERNAEKYPSLKKQIIAGVKININIYNPSIMLKYM